MQIKPDILSLAEDFEDFFENSLCGFVTADTEGKILRGNAKLASWLGLDKCSLTGKRFSDLLTIGGKIFYETHLWPLLRMQGFFEEVAVELLCCNGEKIQVFLNGSEHRDKNGTSQFIRFAILKATDRRLYEENLLMAKKIAETNLDHERNNALLREQFIAVLGHDLRNPLGSIIAANAILAESLTDEFDQKMIAIMQKSAKRMAELINSVMDFARARLGQGILLNFSQTELEPVLMQVADELRVAWPERIIEYHFSVKEPVLCDASRISQLLSNLLANAITHGAAAKPVYVNVSLQNNIFELAVINSGVPIPANAIERLFQPFTREETHPSQNGLGLGLYIASEIAKAHNGTLSVTSNEEQTCFTFRMKNNLTPETAN